MSSKRKGSQEKAASTALSRREQRNAAKKQQKEEPLIPLTSEDENSDTPSENTTSNSTSSENGGSPTKKQRSSSENDMETDLSGQYTPSPSQLSSQVTKSAANSSSARAAPDLSTGLPPDRQTSNLGNSPPAVITPQDISLSEEQRNSQTRSHTEQDAPDPTTSRHDPRNRDLMDTEDVDNDDLDVALSSNVTRFRAAVSFTDVIRVGMLTVRSGPFGPRSGPRTGPKTDF